MFGIWDIFKSYLRGKFDTIFLPTRKMCQLGKS